VFAGFAPETRPEIAVLVVIDEPRGSHYGGVVAAPVFKRILSETFNYLNIPPDLGEEERLVAGMSNGG